MEPILQLQKVSGGYNPNKPVLHDLSMNVFPGEMVGLIGLNGAGKSTTMKHILGLMQQHEGRILINGKTLREAPDAYREAYAFVPESPLLYDELTVREHLELTSMAYGLDKKTYSQRVDPLVDEFHMRNKLDSFTAHLSKGMKQKMMIMNAFLVRPKLYIIDEPFVGLDPLGIRSLLELMVRMKQSGASILMSSHILSTIEKYCDRFIVLHQGRIIAGGTLVEVSKKAGMPGAPLEEVFYTLIEGGA